MKRLSLLLLTIILAFSNFVTLPQLVASAAQTDSSKIRILEIIDQGATQLSPLDTSKYLVETIRMKKFVALRQELNGKYDLIYFGSGTYSTEAVPPNSKGSAANHDTKSKMNDITKLKMDEIENEFINKGQPVVIHNDILNQSPEGKLKSRLKGYKTKTLNHVRFVESSTQAKDAIVQLTSTIFSMKPKVIIKQAPVDYSSNQSEIYKAQEELSYQFEISNYDQLASKNFTAKLYIDGNFNHCYEPVETVVTQEVTSKSGELQYTLPPGTSGVRYWKLEVSNSSGVADYQTGVLRFSDQQVVINVLQVTNGNNISSLKNNNNMNQSYLSTDDYMINIDIISMGNSNGSDNNTFNNPSIYRNLNGKYDMLIFGFADSYNGSAIISSGAAEAVQDFIETGQSVMFTHDTVFQTNNNWVKYFMDDTGQKPPQTDLGYGAPNTSTSTKRVNEGLLTQFPFILSDNVTINNTHNQYYTMDLEDQSVIPWYNIIGSNRDSDDSWNHYYTYSKGNVTYSGTGHTNTGFPDAEQKLFVNTMYRAFIGSNHAPQIDVFTPIDKQKLKTTDELIVAFKAYDFDLTEPTLKTEIWINNQKVDENNVPNGQTLLYKVNGPLYEGTLPIKIVAVDQKGARIEKTLSVMIEKIESHFQLNRAILNHQAGQPVEFGKEITLEYSVKPEDLQNIDEAPATSVTGLRPIGIPQQTFTYGQEIEFLQGGTILQGNWGGLAFDGTGIGNENTEGKFVYDLINGYNKPVMVGAEFYTEPGNVDNKVQDAFSQLVGETITLPLVKTLDVNGSSTPIEVTGFATFELIENANGRIVGKFKGYGKDQSKQLNLTGVTFTENFPSDVVVNQSSLHQGFTMVKNADGTTTVSGILPDFNYVKNGTKYVSESKTFQIQVTPRPEKNSVVILDDSYIEHTGLNAPEYFNQLTLEVVTKVNSMTLNPTNLKLKIGESQKIVATIQPSNATNQALKWEIVEGSSFITLDQTGVVTGLNPGKAKVKVTTVDGGFTGNCEVEVYAPNQIPTARPIDDQTTTVGIPITLDISETFIDPDGDTLTITARSSDTSKAEVSKNGNTLTIDPKAEGTVTITVTANDENGGTVSTTFTVTVTRSSSSNNNLINLALSSGTLDPTFASATVSYTAMVSNNVSSITVTPTASDSNATIKVNGTSVTSGTASGSISLAVGNNNVIRVEVTAQDETTKTYTVIVTREASGNAKLKSLVLSSGTLTPSFDQNKTDYEALVIVTNKISTITVTPTAVDSNSTITVNGNLVTNGMASQAITLNAGETTTVLIKVTAQNGTIEEYKILVKVQLNPEFTATLDKTFANDGIFGNVAAIKITPVPSTILPTTEWYVVIDGVTSKEPVKTGEFDSHQLLIKLPSMKDDKDTISISQLDIVAETPNVGKGTRRVELGLTNDYSISNDYAQYVDASAKMEVDIDKTKKGIENRGIKVGFDYKLVTEEIPKELSITFEEVKYYITEKKNSKKLGVLSVPKKEIKVNGIEKPNEKYYKVFKSPDGKSHTYQVDMEVTIRIKGKEDEGFTIAVPKNDIGGFMVISNENLR